MNIMKDVIQEEGNRLEALIKNYDEKISNYPKGSLSEKKRGGNLYYYRAFRDEKGKIRFEYLGKEDSLKVTDFKKKVEDRKRYEQKRKIAKEKMKEIRKLLRVAI